MPSWLDANGAIPTEKDGGWGRTMDSHAIRAFIEQKANEELPSLRDDLSDDEKAILDLGADFCKYLPSVKKALNVAANIVVLFPFGSGAVVKALIHGIILLLDKVAEETCA